SLGRGTTPRIVNQDLAHLPRRHRQKVRAILSVERRLLADKPQIGFMNQRCALQCVSRTFLFEMVVCDVAQFLVDQGNQSLESLLVASSPAQQKFAYRLRRWSTHTHGDNTAGK